MKKFDSVRFHKGFLNGEHQSAFAVDEKHLSDAEREALLLFIHYVVNSKEHDGSNKQSGKAFGHEFDDKKTQRLYREQNAWHYHCGPSYNLQADYQPTDWYLPENNLGKESPEVIHYSLKQLALGTKPVSIMGFSRNHIPFLSSSDPNNPLRTRFSTPNESVEHWGGKEGA